MKLVTANASCSCISQSSTVFIMVWRLNTFTKKNPCPYTFDFSRRQRSIIPNPASEVFNFGVLLMNILIMRGLQERARSEASFASDGLQDLEAEYLALIQREEQLAERLELARRAKERALAFKPRGTAEYLCPCCAVYSNAKVELAEIGVNDGHRHFVCTNCGNEFDFEMQLKSETDPCKTARLEVYVSPRLISSSARGWRDALN